MRSIPCAAGTTVWRPAIWLRSAGPGIRVQGRPTLATGPAELAPAVGFDGEHDGIFLASHPLAGAVAFTVEALFRPEGGGGREQRFVHLQAEASPDRILLETRAGPDGTWFADTFVALGGHEQYLNSPQLLHPLDRWHSLAVVGDGATIRQFVNGREELCAPQPKGILRAGHASLGIRANGVSPFRGQIARVRLSPLALPAAELWRPPLPAGATS